MAEKCETCRFFDKYRISEDTGLCRKNPPMPVTLSGSPDAVAVWPEVEEDDWCGEHQSKIDRHPLNLVDDAVAKERQRCIDAIIDIGRFVSDENWSDRFNEIVDKIKSPQD